MCGWILTAAGGSAGLSRATLSCDQRGAIQMVRLKDRWAVFGGIVLDPWTLLLIVATACLFYASTLKASPVVSSLLSILITLSSAILGGRATKQWMDITEHGILAARGRSAVRGLKLLLRNITALERRVSSFCADEERIAGSSMLTVRNYQEITETCNLLEEETVNSIENWTDIVPEADMKTQICLISELKRAIKEKEDDVQTLKEQMGKAIGESEKDKERLHKEVRDRERQIEKLQSDLVSSQIGLGLKGVSDFTSSLSFSGPSEPFPNIMRTTRMLLSPTARDASDASIQITEPKPPQGIPGTDSELGHG